MRSEGEQRDYDDAACGLLSCSPTGQLHRINLTLRRWLDLPADAAITSLYELLTPASLLFFEMQLRPLLSLGRTVDGAFITLRHRDGSQLPVVLNASQSPGSQRIALAMIVVREREQYEASLRQSQADAEGALAAMAASAHGQKMQAVGQMAAGVAHEFNNLLAVIRGNLSFAQQGVQVELPGDQRILEDLDSAMIATDRASAIVRQLLAFTGRQIVRRSLVDLNGVVEDSAQLVVMALGRDVTWQTRLAHDLWPVFAPTDQLQHVLTNLVLNARDAIRARGEPGLITVTTSNVNGTAAEGDGVRLRVEDTGIGMPDEVRARAFDPFFTTKPVGQGMGLGLSMVYGTIEALGGRTTIDSTAGQGTRVTITLPRATP
jgi:signal transduction histidine kinase